MEDINIATRPLILKKLSQTQSAVAFYFAKIKLQERFKAIQISKIANGILQIDKISKNFTTYSVHAKAKCQFIFCKQEGILEIFYNLKQYMKV